MYQWKVEEFFDEHPNPFNIEINAFEGLNRILVYADLSGETDDSYLFELKFKDWKKARHYARILSNLLSAHLDIFRIGKKLFLRKLSF
jgi:hypothetical protein